MKKLSNEQYLNARNFLLYSARPLEGSIFKYEFESGDVEDIIENLKKYQNEDGGFGKGLEPDVRYEGSSVLASTIALQHLSKINSEKKLELVKDSFNFLKKTFNNDECGWENVPKEVVSAPRAIWWEYDGVHHQWGNPNAEILGYFYEYPDLIEPEFKELVTNKAIDYLNNVSDLEMHEMYCYYRLSERLPEELNQRILEKLDNFVDKCVVKEPSERNGYCAVPLNIVKSPSSSYFAKYADVIPYDLDQLIETQKEDGSWEPNWSWGRYEQEWEKAREEWKGYITLNNLQILRSFNRIE